MGGAELADVVGGERRHHVGGVGPTRAQGLVDLVVGDVADGLDVDVGVRLLERVDGRLDRRDLARRAPAVPERDGHVGVRVVVRAALRRAEARREGERQGCGEGAAGERGGAGARCRIIVFSW